MLEIVVAGIGGLFTLIGLAWRFGFHRTGIPAVRAGLSDPDPKVRAAALDRLTPAAGTFGPELLDLARRELAPEVHDALTRLVERMEKDPWPSRELEELRARVDSWTGMDPTVLAQLSGWTEERAAALLTQLEHALGQPVVSLRVLTSSGSVMVKPPKEKQ